MNYETASAYMETSLYMTFLRDCRDTSASPSIVVYPGPLKIMPD